MVKALKECEGGAVLNHKKEIENRDLYDKTITFAKVRDSEANNKKTLTVVYDLLTEKGYNAINQLRGYILTEDPTYITTYGNARMIIQKIDRDELLESMIKFFLVN